MGGTSTDPTISVAPGTFAPTASPTFTGIPLVPTAAPGTNTTQAASTAFVAALLVQQASTVSAPAYVLGGLYFDLTLNKLRVGGATAWETVTSA